MGNSKPCCSKIKQIEAYLFDVIRQNNPGDLRRFLNKLQKGSYDKPYTLTDIDKIKGKHGEILINALGLSLLLGNYPIFELLLEKRCSITLMEEILQHSRIHPLEYLCRKGFADILELYLPYYVENMKKRASVISLLSIETINISSISSQFNSIYPFHIACKHGNINVIDKLTIFSQELVCILPEFDIEAKIEGETCALIACRTGDLNLVVYLHSECMANFDVVNSNNENAIAICIISMNENRGRKKEFFRVIRYLIEDAGVDVLFNCEDLLLLAKYSKLVKYLESQLKERGFMHTKEQIEAKYSIAKDTNSTNRDTMCSRLFTESFKKY